MTQEHSIEEIMKVVSAKLAELRKQKGYTSHENFAIDHNIARMQYWRIEKGKTNITLKTLVKLLAIHQVSLNDFFADLNLPNNTIEDVE